LHFHGTSQMIYIVGNYMLVNKNTKETNAVSIELTVPQMHHIITCTLPTLSNDVFNSSD